MKFTVQFINDSKITQLGSINEGINLNKTFKYELNKTHDLSQHIANIHKSLVTLGFPIKDLPESFSLRMRPIVKVENKEFPIYLDGNIENILAKCNELPKIIKKKGFFLEFILTPELRAKRFVEGLQNLDSNSIKLKELVFNLSTELSVTTLSLSSQNQIIYFFYFF